MNNYNANGRTVYTCMVLPTSSLSPPPTPAYNNNPNGIGGDTGENDYALAVTAGINVSGSDVVKRKRGRPRKYALDGPMPLAAAATMTSTTLHGSSAAKSGDFSSLLPATTLFNRSIYSDKSY
ncbi:hypothetical protein L6452_15079 [Arctium lappa]|uniref:Uncharacterized protein n=1 Tax=Arctium lappa TaxID=4217 RepID=A0ACB9CN08_ARCLA|nr:hypothetical protein L6452_15079 [Arctium lappa]